MINYNLPDEHNDGSTISLFSDDSDTFCYPEIDKEWMDTAMIGDVFNEQIAQERKSHISLLEMEPHSDSTSHPQDYGTPGTNLARRSAPSQAPAVAVPPQASTTGFIEEMTATTLPAPDKKSSTSFIQSVVARVGGKPNRSHKKSAVQLRREQLEQKWASERTPAEGMTRKVTWQSSNGRYKKRVVLDYADRKVTL